VIVSSEESDLVRLRGVSIGYGGRPILAGIDLSVRAGETLAVVGPNGAGKTTLLFTMLGMIPPVSGGVFRRARLTAGYVPQRGRHDSMIPLRAAEVVAMGGMGARGGGSWLGTRFATRAETRAALVDLGVDALAGSLFRDLSGGQQQRVLIARALVRRPELLVLDEPTAGMDLPSERDLLDLVSGLAATQRMAVVIVTHHLSLAAQYAQRIAILNRDQALFAVDDTPALVTAERLAGLYGRGMDIVTAGGLTIIRPQARQG
jgi:ABC-type Mn2+/Zn2+ transport system ATPase subunit